MTHRSQPEREMPDRHGKPQDEVAGTQPEPNAKKGDPESPHDMGKAAPTNGGYHPTTVKNQ